MDELGKALDKLGDLLPPVVALLFVLFGYFAIVIDRRREGSPSRDDTQVGLKLALWAVMLIAALSVTEAVHNLLWYVLGGFKGGWKYVARHPENSDIVLRQAIRTILPTLIASGGVGAGIYLLLMPRTNNNDKPQIERFALGAVAVIAAVFALQGLDAFLAAILSGSKWAIISGSFAGLAAWAGLGGFALFRLGAMSGWKVPVRVPRMPMSPPMTGPQGGYPPTGTGYPPQGGVPPLGGGYPPQQGGGGYPPQQGGGGWPPVQ